jgi:hypothetical protein
VPATVRAGQHHRDVVVIAALLHPEVGAADRRRAGAVPQAGEPEEVLEQVPVCTNAKEPVTTQESRCVNFCENLKLLLEIECYQFLSQNC